MASESKTETETTAEIVSTADPIETFTDESSLSSSLNEDKSNSNPEEDDDFSDENEDSDESVNEEDDKESENDEEDRGSIVDDGDSTSSKPEWGVDSFDESSDYFSADEDSYTDEEDERDSRIYLRNLYFSHGFLVEKNCRGSISLKSLDSDYSPVKGRTQLQYAQDMVKLCLHKYNALNETDVKLDHVVRVTGKFYGRWISYITFMAKESEENTLVEYQAKVVKKLKCKSYPIFCRPSPKMDQEHPNKSPISSRDLALLVYVLRHYKICKYEERIIL